MKTHCSAAASGAAQSRTVRTAGFFAALAALLAAAPSTLYTVAGRDSRARELVLQMANPLGQAVRAIGQPGVVAPRTSEFNEVAPSFVHTLEPNSPTTLRIPEN